MTERAKRAEELSSEAAKFLNDAKFKERLVQQ